MNREISPKVSILMSSFNPNEIFLRECFDSIENQTFKDFELILVDDGSFETDFDSILSNYSFRYTLIKNSQNLGVSRSMNNGLKVCNGSYIAKMDDDDIMHPDRLKLQYEFLQN
ncbi:TPA: glycosyltransferase family 2 protein, partial [Streptococcus suis]